MRAPWPFLVLLLAGSVLAAACGVRAESDPRTIRLGLQDDEAGTDAAPTEEPIPPVEVAASVYLVTGDGRLRATTREVAASRDADEHLADVLEVLVQGPTTAEASSGLRSVVPSTTEVLAVTLDDGTATVDLSPAFASIGGSRELLAVGQLVLTVTTFPGARRVEVRLGGRPTGLPLPDGSLTEAPVTLLDYAPLLAPEATSPTTTEAGS